MDRSPQNCALVSIRIRDYNSKDGTHFFAFHAPFSVAWAQMIVQAFLGQFSANSTQLELTVFEFFWNFGLSFFEILLQF